MASVCFEGCQNFLAAPNGKAKVCGLIALTVLACAVLGLMGTALGSPPHTLGARIFTALTLPGVIVLTAASAGVLIGVAIYGVRSCRISSQTSESSIPMPPNRPVEVPRLLSIKSFVGRQMLIELDTCKTWGELKSAILKELVSYEHYKEHTPDNLQISILAQGNYRKIVANSDESLHDLLLRYSCQINSHFIVHLNKGN